jgi:hypothetical protein
MKGDPMSWRVFFVPRMTPSGNRSVVESVRNLSYNAGIFTFDGTPALPNLTFQAGEAIGTDSGYNYTLKIRHSDPLNATYFLGQFLKENKSDPTDYWYDTILAVDNDNLDNAIAHESSLLYFEAPLGKLLKKNYAGGIDLADNKISVETPSGVVSFPFTKSDDGHGMWNDGHSVDGEDRRFGAIFTNYIKLNGLLRSILFGHFHWGGDLEIHVPGDKTEPFVAIQPPPPLPCDDSRAEEKR